MGTPRINLGPSHAGDQWWTVEERAVTARALRTLEEGEERAVAARAARLGSRVRRGCRVHQHASTGEEGRAVVARALRGGRCVRRGR
eukprot:2204031-Rhodomonas_salina.3